MLQMIEANWLIFIAALLVGIAVAFWVFVRSSKPQRREHRPDVLDEGAAPAQRNQALIDSQPPAAQFHIDPPAMAGTMAGIGEVIAAGAQEEVAAVRPVVQPKPAAPVMAKPLPEAEPVVAAEPVQEDAPATSAEAASAPVEAESAPVVPVVEEPVVEATPAAVPAADDLRKIKGLGPKMLTLLHALGVTTYAQIAAWTDADLDELDTKLGAFAGRPRRDSWVEQAKLLSSGDIASYESQFGKL